MDCYWLSHGISIEKRYINDCCLLRDTNFNGSPFVMDLDENNLVDWDKLFALKRVLRNLKKTEEKSCKGCRALEDDFNFDNDESYISFINFNHWNRCNSKCIYCSSIYNGGDRYFNVLPLIKSLIEYKDGKYIRGTGEFTFQGGEPTLLPEFEELLDLLMVYIDKHKMRIHSSGIKYSKSIEKGLKENLLQIIVSPDSAIKETYEKIKRVEAYELVWENLRKYATVQKTPDNVRVKFIIIPGVNDTIEEADAFLDKIQEINVHYIVLDIEGRCCAEHNYDIPQAAMLLDYITHQANKRNIEFELYDGAIYVNKNRKHEPSVVDETFKAKYDALREEYSCKNFDYSRPTIKYSIR